MQPLQQPESSGNERQHWVEQAGVALGRLLTIAVALVAPGLVVGFSYVTFSLLVTGQTAADSRGGQILAVLDDHWKPLVVITVVTTLVLFYQAIKGFIERIRHFSVGAGGVTFKTHSRGKNPDEEG